MNTASSKAGWSQVEITPSPGIFLGGRGMVHEYGFRVFPDPEYGEWYVCLDPINRVKWTNRKCCYHIGRSFLWAFQLAARF